MTHDPHQSAEASAFALMPQAGPAAIDTTGDLFGFDYDDLEHWHNEQAAFRCASHHRRSSAATDDLFSRSDDHECPECGELTTDVIGCPDGEEICRQCFDAGMH